MATIERELKYKINTLPLSLNEPFYIKQCYFNPVGIENLIIHEIKLPTLEGIHTYRYRTIKYKDETKYVLTLKSKGMYERKEYEKEVDENFFEILTNQPTLSCIIKNRYVVNYDGFNFEFDEYLNLNVVLYTVEIELDKKLDEETKNHIENILKEYFKVDYIDVTLDNRYKNSNLIKEFGEKK